MKIYTEFISKRAAMTTSRELAGGIQIDGSSWLQLCNGSLTRGFARKLRYQAVSG